MGLILHVLGTDTGVGKTLVTAGLARALAARGRKVALMKPFATGATGATGAADGQAPPDTAALLAALPGPSPAQVTPWSAGPPLAPLVAARLTGRPLDPSEVAEAVRARAAREDLCVVEGIGGVLTPIAPGSSYLDFAAGLGGAALVVARPGLGTLNHTALTVRAVREAGVPVLGVVLSRASAGPPDLAEETNPGVLAETVPAPVLATIAHLGADPRADALPLAPFGPLADAVEAAFFAGGGPSVRLAHELVTRVRYQETDQMGVVYHGNYLLYFEMGRTELLRELGLPYSDLEREGIRLAVTEATARYHAPARYDDRIKIRTRLAEVGRARIAFAYEVSRADDGRLMAEGRTVLACLDAGGRPRRLPERVLALLGASGRSPRPVAGARP